MGTIVVSHISRKLLRFQALIRRKRKEIRRTKLTAGSAISGLIACHERRDNRTTPAKESHNITVGRAVSHLAIANDGLN